MYEKNERISIGYKFSARNRFGKVKVSFLLFTGTYNKVLPYVLMGSLTIAASVVNFFLPETLNKDLPETVEQMQQCQGWVTRVSVTHIQNIMSR